MKRTTSLTVFLFHILTVSEAQISSLLPPETVSIQSPFDIDDKRQQLIDYMWGTSGWPTARIPNVVDSAFIDSQYTSLKDSLGNLLRIDRYTIKMPYGFESYVYHFIPMRSNSKLFIYHAGHGWGFQWEDKVSNNDGVEPGFVIPELIKEGYAVLGFSMPLQGNNIPTEPVAGMGTIDWMPFGSGGHLQMFMYLENPFSYFFDPLIIALNYVEDNYEYERIYMTGLSGGGWTSVFYPALDTRIDFSFPVAGSVPLYLRVGFEGVGDVEQGYDYNTFLGIANYTELYIMGSYGEGRGQLQINNRYDACCFYGTRDQYWVDSVKLAMDHLNGYGRYNFFLDESHHQHTISKAALAEIFKFIRYYEGKDSTSLIVSQPETITVCPGDSAAMSIKTGDPGLTYRWQVHREDGGPFEAIDDNLQYDGSDSATLVVRGITESMNGYVYRCVVMGDSIPTTASYSYTLYVRPETSFTGQPQNAVLCPGADVSFEVVARGSELEYKWEVDTGDGFRSITDSVAHQGINAATLVVKSPADSLAGYFYRCKVAGICRAIVTDSVAFVLPEPITITQQPTHTTVCAETDAELTLSASGAPIQYRWQANAGSGFNDISDTLFHGYNSARLLIKSTPDSLNGFTFRGVISNGCEMLVTDTISLAVNSLASVDTSPNNQFVCPGEEGMFFVAASGIARRYQWQENDGNGFKDIQHSDLYEGYNTSTLLVKPGAFSQTGMTFRAIVSNACNSILTDEATLTVGSSPIIEVHPVDDLFCSNGEASFTVNAIGENLRYQWQVNDGQGFVDIPVNSDLFEGVDSTSLRVKVASEDMNGYFFRCSLQGSCSSSTFYTDFVTLSLADEVKLLEQPASISVCAGAEGQFTVRGTGTNLEYQWQENNGNGFQAITNAAVYDGYNGETLVVREASEAIAGVYYRCLITGVCGAPITTRDVSITVRKQVSITAQPSNATVCEGGTVSVAVGATGTDLVYRWQREEGGGFIDLGNVPGTTIDGNSISVNTLLYEPSKALQALRCVVSGTCGPDQISDPAWLKILKLPEISLSGLEDVYCHDASAVALMTVPEGGILTGKGVVGSTYNPSFAGIGIDTIEYSFTDNVGCSNQLKSITIIQDCKSKDPFRLISTYPNPAKEVIQLVFESQGLRTLTFYVTDMHGRRVLEKQWNSQVGENAYLVDVSCLTRGPYNVKVVSSGKILYSKKIIVRE